MILKINNDFTDLDSILEKIKSYNNVFYKDTLYISCFDGTSKNDFIKKIKRVLGSNIFITQINENNLKNESFYIQQWCKDEFLKEDKIRYEKENQEKLDRMMKFLDMLENEILKEGSGL